MIIDYKDKTLILRHEQDDSLYDPSSRAEWMKLKVVLASNFKTCPVCKDGSLTLSEYMATRCTAAYDKYSPHKGTYETVHRIYCNGNHQMNVVKFMVNKKAVFFRHEFVVPVVETNARIPTVQPLGDTGFAAIP
jgi:uncharacterized protein with PIN domain